MSDMDYTNFLKRLGAAVRERRLDNKKSQEAIAIDLGIHQSNLSKLEKGIQGFDSKTLFELGQALDTPLHKLFQEVERTQHHGKGQLNGGSMEDRRVQLLDDDERTLVRLFESSNAKGRAIFLSMAEMIAKANPVGANVVSFRHAGKKAERLRRKTR